MAYLAATKLAECPPQNTYDNGPQRRPYISAEVLRLRGLLEELEETRQAVETKFSPALRQEPTKGQDKVGVESSGCELADELSRICETFTVIRDDFRSMIDRCEL